MEVKICSKCKRELPATTDYFYKSKKGKFGLYSICKECKGTKFGVNKNIQYDKAKEGFKICTKCNKELPKTNEYFSLRHRYGKVDFNSWCKECADKINREWKKENKDEVKKYNEKYSKNYYKENKESLAEYGKQYQLHNKEKIKTYRKKYRAENSERLKEGMKIYYENNKEKIAERVRQYYQEHKEEISEKSKKHYEDNKEKITKRNEKYRKLNPEKITICRQRRRTRKHQLPSALTAEQWEQIKQHFNNKCAYCGKELPLTQEHFIPLSKGGEYTINNIIPACKSCNSRKNSKYFFEWYPKYRYYSKKREKAILDFLGYKNDEQQLSLI